MKNNLPLFYYQPNSTQYLEKSISVNSLIFKDIIVLKETEYPLFESVYKHMCSNGELFEKLCFLRFFFMLNYVKSNHIDKFLYCDTDAVFLKNLDFEKMLGDESCLACKPKEQDPFEDVCGAHFSVWTKDGLSDFCNFIIDTYNHNIDLLEPKWKWHKTYGVPGGVCDMTLLYHWYKNKKSLLDYYDGGTFDRAISSPDNSLKNEFLMNGGIKKLEKNIDGYFTGYNNKIGKVELFGLHFQGNAKHLMYSL